jgi:uncharacterized protein YbjQ (UPF0145 family)
MAASICWRKTQGEDFMKHVRTVLVVLAMALVMIGCVTTDSTSYSVTDAHSGFIRDIAIPAKDFDIVGLVFYEAIVENGNNGERLTYNALLREAERLGGNGIVNVMIDVRRERHTTTTTSMMRGGATATRVREVWYGSALAIRYTDTVAPDTPMSSGGRALTGGGTGEVSGTTSTGGGLLGGLLGGR